MNVLIMYDLPGWCHHMIAKSIKHYYDGDAKIEIACQNDAGLKQRFSRFDLFISIGWPSFKHTRTPRERSLIGIRGYASLPSSMVSGLNVTLKELVNGTAGLLCANRDLASKWKTHHPNVHVCYSAGDPRLWYPLQVPRQRSTRLIVGWAGNAQRRVKRVKELLFPAIKLVCEKVYLLMADKNTSYIPTSEMRERFYYKIDVLVCTSETEGTPNPALEAMLCGVPVLSTRVGHLVEIIKNDVSGWLIDGTVTALSQKLRELADNRDKVELVGKAALEVSQRWTWRYKIADWRRAIESTIR